MWGRDLMSEKKEDSEKFSNKTSKKMMTWLLATILHLPRRWLIIGSVFILLSLFDVAWLPEEGLSITFRVTSTTAIFLGLIWLPSLLKIFAIRGGGIKTPVGEITSPGLVESISQIVEPMEPEEKGEALGTIIGILERAEERAPSEQKEELRKISQDLVTEYSLGISPEQARNEIDLLSQRYKELRETMSPGSQRTINMESVAQRMRALAPKSGLSPVTIESFLGSEDQGNRLIGLSILESTGDVYYFEPLLKIIDENSKSAFEQYHALRAAEKMLPHLDHKNKKALQKALNKQCEYDEDKKQWIKPQSDRWWIAKRLLSEIGE